MKIIFTKQIKKPRKLLTTGIFQKQNGTILDSVAFSEGRIMKKVPAKDNAEARALLRQHMVTSHTGCKELTMVPYEASGSKETIEAIKKSRRELRRSTYFVVDSDPLLTGLINATNGYK